MHILTKPILFITRLFYSKSLDLKVWVLKLHCPEAIKRPAELARSLVWSGRVFKLVLHFTCVCRYK